MADTEVTYPVEEWLSLLSLMYPAYGQSAEQIAVRNRLMAGFMAEEYPQLGQNTIGKCAKKFSHFPSLAELSWALYVGWNTPVNDPDWGLEGRGYRAAMKDRSEAERREQIENSILKQNLIRFKAMPGSDG